MFYREGAGARRCKWRVGCGEMGEILTSVNVRDVLINPPVDGVPLFLAKDAICQKLFCSGRCWREH